MEHYNKTKLMNNGYRRRINQGQRSNFNKIRKDNFPNQNKEMPFNMQESYRTSIRQYQKRNSP